jgi:omega-6 fatty acid desaturase (delta-12 desaturase)
MHKNIEEKIRKDLKGWTKIVSKYTKPSGRKALIQILNTFIPYTAIWVLMYFSLEWSYFITLGLAVIAAFFTVRIFIIQHDCGHQNYFKRKWMNQLIGSFCSPFSFIPFNYWATNHNFHHVHSGQLETRSVGDIDTLTVEEYRAMGAWDRLKYRMFRHPLVLFFVGPVYYLAIVNRLPFAHVKGWKKTLLNLTFDNLLVAAVYVVVALLIGWKKFLMVQIPVTVFFGIIAVWFFYVQHQHEHAYKAWKANWDYLISAIKGSTYYKLPRVIHWLTGNIGYHHIHHLSSGIPNYNLRKCAEENPIFQKYVTKITFWKSLKLMSHKLWDEDSGRMITFKEFKKIEQIRMAA